LNLQPCHSSQKTKGEKLCRFNSQKPKAKNSAVSTHKNQRRKTLPLTKSKAKNFAAYKIKGEK
jgi:hypothetical protein